MDDKRSSADVLNAASIKFVLTERDVAMTMMAVASTTTVDETSQRGHKNARTAYDSALRFLPHIKLNASQQYALDKKLATLKMQLESVGQQF